MVKGSLVVFASGFGPEGLGLISDALKHPPSVCSVYAHKIHGSEIPVVGHKHFNIGIVCEKKKSPLHVRDMQKLWKCKWCCRLSSRGRNRTPDIIKWASLLRSNVSLCLKALYGAWTSKWQAKTTPTENNNKKRKNEVRIFN